MRGWPTGRSRLARVDVADNDHVDVRLLFTVKMTFVSKYFISCNCGGTRNHENRRERDIDIPHGGGLNLL